MGHFYFGDLGQYYFGANNKATGAVGAKASRRTLAINPGESAATVLAVVLGQELNPETAAEMSAANEDLLSLNPVALMKPLARSLVVVSALGDRLVLDAMATTNPTAKAALLRTALQAKRETRELVILLRELQREALDASTRPMETIDA